MILDIVQLFFGIYDSGEKICLLLIQMVSATILEGSTAQFASLVQGIGALLIRAVVTLADVVVFIFTYSHVFRNIGIFKIQ